jgi:recombinational DNA repair protein (RecF pathway)
MRDERTNSGAPDQPTGRQCSGCRRVQPPDQFYTYGNGKHSSRCKSCQCETARRTGRDRRHALRLLIAVHNDEYRALLRAQRNRHGDGAAPGGGADVA